MLTTHTTLGHPEYVLAEGTRVLYTGSMAEHHGLYRVSVCECRRCCGLGMLRYRLKPTGATRTPACGGDPKCVRRASLTVVD
ncbi:hypothetical protein [Streptomyces sp. NPDC087300]|uniref:hypothetical protein n=1 Tax=Streptomyces sp. NPDC087300 TaxID=3365780 RepID=UPI0037F46729